MKKTIGFVCFLFALSGLGAQTIWKGEGISLDMNYRVLGEPGLLAVDPGLGLQIGFEQRVRLVSTLGFYPYGDAYAFLQAWGLAYRYAQLEVGGLWQSSYGDLPFLFLGEHKLEGWRGWAKVFPLPSVSVESRYFQGAFSGGNFSGELFSAWGLLVEDVHLFNLENKLISRARLDAVQFLDEEDRSLGMDFSLEFSLFRGKLKLGSALSHLEKTGAVPGPLTDLFRYDFSQLSLGSRPSDQLWGQSRLAFTALGRLYPLEYSSLPVIKDWSLLAFYDGALFWKDGQGWGDGLYGQALGLGTGISFYSFQMDFKWAYRPDYSPQILFSFGMGIKE